MIWRRTARVVLRSAIPWTLRTSSRRVLVVDEDERPDLVSRFGVTGLPTLVGLEGRAECARLEQPRGCREIEGLLGPWLR